MSIFYLEFIQMVYPSVVLLIRVHHAIGDGLSMVQALQRVFTDSEGKDINLGGPVC